MSGYRDGFNEVQREGFWTLPRVVFALFVLILVGGGLTFVSTGVDLANYKFWAPKQAAAQREVFVQTPSFVLGKSNRISDLRSIYIRSKDADEKDAIKMQILHEASEINNSLLPEDEQTFINQLRSE